MTEYQPPTHPTAPDAKLAGQSDVRRPHRPRLGRFLLKWVLPLVLYVGGMLLWGMHLGARHPDAWYTTAAGWLFGA